MKHAVAYALVALLGVPVLFAGIARGMELIAGAGFLMVFGGVAAGSWHAGRATVTAARHATAGKRARVPMQPSRERLW